MQKVCKTQLKMKNPYTSICKWLPLYIREYIKTETANYDKVTTTIRGSYLMHADKHTKVFMSKIEELGLYIQKSKVIVKGKL